MVEHTCIIVRDYLKLTRILAYLETFIVVPKGGRWCREHAEKSTSDGMASTGNANDEAQVNKSALQFMETLGSKSSCIATFGFLQS